MASKKSMDHTVYYVSGITLLLGIVMLSAGINEGVKLLVPIGIGTIIAAGFIFLIGIFFIATEEMLKLRDRGVMEAPMMKVRGMGATRPRSKRKRSHLYCIK